MSKPYQLQDRISELETENAGLQRKITELDNEKRNQLLAELRDRIEYLSTENDKSQSKINKIDERSWIIRKLRGRKRKQLVSKINRNDQEIKYLRAAVQGIEDFRRTNDSSFVESVVKLIPPVVQIISLFLARR
ncbi:13231_t:CDS:1 [Acaulospora morrowiae]|uniref:13231_t:CDS:1 n=1 Tax=Acaulospora morrowiae TaxID=94023 RepID=A0A9N9G9E5_9GLOM|nr:13231_t:CDS:1 [Acaulospora morrowiae]